MFMAYSFGQDGVGKHDDLQIVTVFNMFME